MGCLKMVPKGNISEMISNWQISIGYEDNQIMTPLSSRPYVTYHLHGSTIISGRYPLTNDRLMAYILSREMSQSGEVTMLDSLTCRGSQDKDKCVQRLADYIILSACEDDRSKVFDGIWTPLYMESLQTKIQKPQNVNKEVQQPTRELI